MNHFFNRKFAFTVFFPLILCFQVKGQEFDMNREIVRYTPVIKAFNDFSRYIPQEKVYLHFDNTSYYYGDNIWFKCYVTSAQHELSRLSKTLYVELLNPGGELIDKQILKIENGQCHGDFMLNHIPFYSGFYEVRAYTKYMLNFGEEIIFSRLLPVFDKPKIEGNHEEKNMIQYSRQGAGNYPMIRERPESGKAVNLRFFPEGGNLIKGVASRIAFEATDEVGNPINVTGIVLDEDNREVCRFAALHEGRGIFAYTSSGANASRRRPVAEVEHSGKKYRFDLPAVLPHGVVMEVDNLLDSDSIVIALRKNIDTPAQILGVALLSGGMMQDKYLVYITDDEINLRVDKKRLPAGVSQIVLFNGNGEIFCDRLIFTGKNELLDIKAKTDKPAYRPFDLVEMEFSVVDSEANPVYETFSLSVRDGANEVESKHNILTDLLLMSEIKGYVRNPSWYFEDEDSTRRAALDLLLMVQGWRRYLWNQMVGIEPFELKHTPEQGIEINGKVVSLSFFTGKQKPTPNVDVSLFLLKKDSDNESNANFIDFFVTDDQGRFSFISDVSGKWNMIFSVTEKGKKKNYPVILDRIFSPKPQKYRFADLKVSIAEENRDMNDEEIQDDFDSFYVAYQDSLSKAGITDKTIKIPEVTIKAKRNSKEKEMLYNRSTSVAYYDVTSELDALYDSGTFVGNNIYELLMNMDKNFVNNSEFLTYKGKLPLFVVNYQSAYVQEIEPINVNIHEILRLKAIKSIYINENPIAALPYFDGKSKRLAFLYARPDITLEEIFRPYSCVVFIETYPSGEIPVEDGKGMRKTWLEGYSRVREFYHPDYSLLPPDPNDYRRTLYWNPMVTPDENGKATIQFYNNSSCRNFSISAETVTSQGDIGIYQ